MIDFTMKKMIARLFWAATAGKVDPTQPLWMKAYDLDTSRYLGIVGPLLIDWRASYTTPGFAMTDWDWRDKVKLTFTTLSLQSYATESLSDVEGWLRSGRLYNVSPIYFGDALFSYESFDSREMCAVCADRHCHDHGEKIYHMEKRLRPDFCCASCTDEQWIALINRGK